VSDDAPSVSILAGQLGYLFEDDPAARAASDEELAARLSRQDRFARAREKYPILSDDEVAAHVEEFDDRITAEMVRAARARVTVDDD
jgi:hypothetical protein